MGIKKKTREEKWGERKKAEKDFNSFSEPPLKKERQKRSGISPNSELFHFFHRPYCY